MKLVRFGPAGAEKPGVWLDDALGPGAPGVLDVNAMAYDLHDYDLHFFEHGGLERLRRLRADPRPRILPAAGLRLGPPIARPGKIVCLGKNYADHAREFDSQIPTTPVLFSKATTALNGPFDPIRLPRPSRVADGEAELAIVIGRRSKGLSEGEALSAVAGYTVLNDVTDREAQKAGLQWFFGKSFDTFCPLGPFLATADEVPDPHRLRVFSRLNGETLQDGNTADMLFRIPFLLSFIKQAVTLEPGDVIATGTPAGIGSARKPPLVLKTGDRLETGVEGLGTQIAVIESD
jgi:2-keto-4-pentenoate hydratase/2-oxohepta-3-ene-1,7-dioic acid hydratase in catechol pathway